MQTRDCPHAKTSKEKANAIFFWMLTAHPGYAYFWSLPIVLKWLCFWFLAFCFCCYCCCCFVGRGVGFFLLIFGFWDFFLDEDFQLGHKIYEFIKASTADDVKLECTTNYLFGAVLFLFTAAYWSLLKKSLKPGPTRHSSIRGNL